MEDSVRNKLILVLTILTVIFFIFAISSCFNIQRQKMARDKEMALRMDLEEKISKFNQEKAKLEDKIKAQEQVLEEEKAAHELTKEALSQEELVNKSLREELDKITKLKDTLEDDLKEALVNKPSKSQR